MNGAIDLTQDLLDKHADIPKADVMAEICLARKEEFEQFIAQYFAPAP